MIDNITDYRAGLREQEAKCRHLWRSVAVCAIVDASAEIIKTEDQHKAKAIARNMIYFKGPNWREICELAGVTYAPHKIHRHLSGARIAKTVESMKVSYGLITGGKGSQFDRDLTDED